MDTSTPFTIGWVKNSPTTAKQAFIFCQTPAGQWLTSEGPAHSYDIIATEGKVNTESAKAELCKIDAWALVETFGRLDKWPLSIKAIDSMGEYVLIAEALYSATDQATGQVDQEAFTEAVWEAERACIDEQNAFYAWIEGVIEHEDDETPYPRG